MIDMSNGHNDTIKKLQLMDKSLEYIRIIENHTHKDFSKGECFDQILDDFKQIFDALPIMIEIAANYEMPKLTDPPEKLYIFYDILKVFANLCMLEDALLPIARKYNPSEDDKKKIVEFIKSHPLPGNPIDDLCQELIDDDKE